MLLVTTFKLSLSSNLIVEPRSRFLPLIYFATLLLIAHQIGARIVVQPILDHGRLTYLFQDVSTSLIRWAIEFISYLLWLQQFTHHLCLFLFHLLFYILQPNLIKYLAILRALQDADHDLRLHGALTLRLVQPTVAVLLRKYGAGDQLVLVQDAVVHVRYRRHLQIWIQTILFVVRFVSNFIFNLLIILKSHFFTFRAFWACWGDLLIHLIFERSKQLGVNLLRHHESWRFLHDCQFLFFDFRNSFLPHRFQLLLRRWKGFGRGRCAGRFHLSRLNELWRFCPVRALKHFMVIQGRALGRINCVLHHILFRGNVLVLHLGIIFNGR